MFHLSSETENDVHEVEYLFDLAFAPGRGALSSYRLRDEVPPVSQLCMVARDAYQSLAGAIRYWPVLIGSDAALLLGPVAVHPTHQGEGLGAGLVAQSLERARLAGWTRVILIGDEPYYRKFGFSRECAKGLEFPAPTNPDRILARALEADAFLDVSGMVRKWSVDQLK